MPMKKTILMLLLAAMSTGAMAEWVKVSETDSGVFYFDPATIRKNGNFRRVWELFDLKRRDPNGEMSRRQLLEHDCNEHRYRFLSISAHSESMGGGSTLAMDNSTDQWRHIPPNTVIEKQFKLVCGK